MEKEYKILFAKLMKFIIVLLIIDFALGTGVKKIYFSQETGKQARITYSIKEALSDVLIFGSSHANRHYVPRVLEETLGQTCYNAGVQGQNIVFHSILQEIILERDRPELVILNVDSDWMYKSERAYDRLCDLHPYYWEFRDIIHPVLKLQSKLTDFKLFFKSYQYNSTIVHAIKYFFFPQNDYNGYLPLMKDNRQQGSLTNNKIPLVGRSQSNKIDKNNVAAFCRFIRIAKQNNVRVMFVVSPTFYERDYSNDTSMELMKKIAHKENIPFIDFSNNPQFLSNNTLFYDGSHLNDHGARLFTKKVVEFIEETFADWPEGEKGTPLLCNAQCR